MARVGIDPVNIYTLKYDQLELGALIRRQVLISLDVLRANGCIVSYREHKGFLFTTLVDLRITGTQEVLRDWNDYVMGLS